MVSKYLTPVWSVGSLPVDSSMPRLESKQRGSTYIASSKFFSAIALLPSALSASAMARYDI
jgi:hypothetical protein